MLTQAEYHGHESSGDDRDSENDDGNGNANGNSYKYGDDPNGALSPSFSAMDMEKVMKDKKDGGNDDENDKSSVSGDKRKRAHGYDSCDDENGNADIVMYENNDDDNNRSRSDKDGENTRLEHICNGVDADVSKSVKKQKLSREAEVEVRSRIDDDSDNKIHSGIVEIEDDSENDNDNDNDNDDENDGISRLDDGDITSQPMNDLGLLTQQHDYSENDGGESSYHLMAQHEDQDQEGEDEHESETKVNCNNGCYNDENDNVSPRINCNGEFSSPLPANNHNGNLNVNMNVRQDTIIENYVANAPWNTSASIDIDNNTPAVPAASVALHPNGNGASASTSRNIYSPIPNNLLTGTASGGASNKNNNHDPIIDATPRRSGNTYNVYPTIKMRSQPQDRDTDLCQDAFIDNAISTIEGQGEGRRFDEDGEDEEDPQEASKSPFDYMKKREANIRRNQARLVGLGFTRACIPKESIGVNELDDEAEYEYEYEYDDIDVEEKQVFKRGMLFSTKYNGIQDQKLDEVSKGEEFSKRSLSLEEQFPHRKSQIHFLRSCFMSTMRQTYLQSEDEDSEIQYDDDDGDVYIPPPIIISGASGTGKTSVVRAVLNEVHLEEKERSNNTKRSGSNIAIAYIDCSTCERRRRGASAILEDAYNQLCRQFGDNENFGLPVKSKKKKKIIKSNLTKLSEIGADSRIPEINSILMDDVDDISVGSSLETGSLCTRDEFEISTLDNEDEEKWLKTQQTKYVKNTSKLDFPAFSITSGTDSYTQNQHRRSTRLEQPTSLKVRGGKVKKTRRVSRNKDMKRSFGVLQSPLTFGRAISQLCGEKQFRGTRPQGCAFLVLDHSEELLSFSGTRQNSHKLTNLLSQLLLLPKAMNLNLTVIAISGKSKLKHTKFSNIDRPANPYATVDDGINPMLCHFNPYQGKDMFLDVFKTRQMQRLILGEENASKAILKLYIPFVEIIINTFQSTTRDIREIARLARLLWPKYIDPLEKGDITRGESFNKTILEKLGEKLWPHLTEVSAKCMMRPGETPFTSSSEMKFCNGLPYVSKFLLLAGYLCQHNKSDQDQNLYTNKAAGRKSRKKNKENFSESLTHASTQETQRQLRAEKMYSFPLERMLSVFSSICNKHACDVTDDEKAIITNQREGNPLDVRRLGKCDLLEIFSELHNMGLIKEATAPKSKDARSLVYKKSTTSVKYICYLSSHQAHSIAESVNFPLPGYLLANK